LLLSEPEKGSSAAQVLKGIRRRRKRTLLERMRVLGRRPRAGFPFICCPLLRDRCTLGVLACDNFAQVGKARDDELHPEPGVLEYLKKAACVIGEGLDVKRKHDALKDLERVVGGPTATVEDLYVSCLKGALFNMPFAVKAQIWKLDRDWDLHVLASLSHTQEEVAGARMIRITKTWVEVFGAQSVAGRDFFVKVMCGGLERRSGLKKAGDIPEWDEQMSFKVGGTVRALTGELWLVDADTNARVICGWGKLDLGMLDSGGEKTFIDAYLYDAGGVAVAKMRLEASQQVVESLSETGKIKGKEADGGFSKSIRLAILEAHGLAKADFIGSSDPFVIVKWREAKLGQTVVINNNLNPVWEDEVFNVNIPEDAFSANLVLEVWDQDGGRTGDFLGQVLLSTHTCALIIGVI
jgi:hypothetical protein